MVGCISFSFDRNKTPSSALVRPKPTPHHPIHLPARTSAREITIETTHWRGAGKYVLYGLVKRVLRTKFIKYLSNTHPYKLCCTLLSDCPLFADSCKPKARLVLSVAVCMGQVSVYNNHRNACAFVCMHLVRFVRESFIPLATVATESHHGAHSKRSNPHTHTFCVLLGRAWRVWHTSCAFIIPIHIIHIYKYI